MIFNSVIFPTVLPSILYLTLAKIRKFFYKITGSGLEMNNRENVQRDK